MTAAPDNPEKAYNKGCMWGMSGGARNACPYAPDDACAQQWHDGWQAGYQAWSKRHPTQAVG